MAGKKFITTKYGTRIDVTGLAPEQVAKVKSVAEDKGAYGAKGAALAKELQKRGQNPSQNPAAGTPEQAAVDTTVPVNTPETGINPKTGAIDPGKFTNAVAGAEERDSQATFNMQNPGSQTDAMGNSQSVTRDPITGAVTVSKTAGALGQGAQAFLGGALNTATQRGPLDLSAERNTLANTRLDLSGAPSILQTGDVRTEAQRVGDANYAYITRNFERDKRRALEDAKQELAQRGIPIDPGNPDSLWNKTVGAINQDFADREMAASNQAIMGRDASMGALIGGQTTARNAFVDSATREFDATTGLAKDSAALKGMESQDVQNQIGTGINAVGATTGQFTPYQGGQVDQSGAILGAGTAASGATQGANALRIDEKTKMAAIRKPTGGGGSGGGGGFAIGGVAP